MHPISRETRLLLVQQLKQNEGEATSGRTAAKEMLAIPRYTNDPVCQGALVSVETTLTEIVSLRERLADAADHEAFLRSVWKETRATELDMGDSSSVTRFESGGRNAILRAFAVILTQRLQKELPDAEYQRIFGSLSP